MNIHTFGDAVTSRREALANEIEDDDEEDDILEGRMRKLSDSVDGEEDESREKFNDAGEVIEPFNLRDEREGGHFDENMNYVFQREKGEVDTWLADMDEATMEKSIGEAAAAYKKKQDENAAKDAKFFARPKKDIVTLKEELVEYLEDGENVWKAIRRISKEAKSNPNSDSKESIHTLTELADELLSLGELNIYEMEKDAIILSGIQWEYMGHEQVIHGPFTTNQMAAWVQQGYFTGTSAVYIRRRRHATAHSLSESSNGNTNTKKRSHEELMSDFSDDEDGIECKQARVSYSAGDASHSSVSDVSIKDPTAQQECSKSSQLSSTRSSCYDVYNDWVLSDSIDFSSVPLSSDVNELDDKHAE